MVENIEKRRQPYPSLEAIYFLTPCRESILRLVDDFSTKPATYKAAHVHFTSGNAPFWLIYRSLIFFYTGLNDELFNELNKRLKSTGASEYVLSLKELYVDFMVNESAVFTVDPVTSFLSLFGEDRMSDPDQSLRLTAKQVNNTTTSTCAYFLYKVTFCMCNFR